MIYKVRDRQLGYGRPVGILVLEENIPCPPGVPGNPTTFDFPVCYEIVRGVSASSLVTDPAPDPAPFIAAGRALVEKGASAIVGGCGLMIAHQAALADALPVPVLTSSLLQLPWALAMMGSGAQMGVVMSRAGNLQPRHLAMAGVHDASRLVVTGMEGCPAFQAAICDESGELDAPGVQAELVGVIEALVAANPAIAAILLECVDLPPYAAAVQQAVSLPVYDVTTLARYAQSAIVRAPFRGVY
jgi:hypothetical protein